MALGNLILLLTQLLLLFKHLSAEIAAEVRLVMNLGLMLFPVSVFWAFLLIDQILSAHNIDAAGLCPLLFLSDDRLLVMGLLGQLVLVLGDV